MFDKQWECQWEPLQLQAVILGEESDFLRFVRRFGVFTGQTADWFYPVKRESKEVLRQLVDVGAIGTGTLRSDGMKITIYSSDPPTDVESCVRNLIFEEMLGIWMERVPELNWDKHHVKVRDRIIELRVHYGNVQSSSGKHDVLWFGSNFKDMEHVVLEGQYATLLDLWKKNTVVQRQGDTWLPILNFGT